MKHLYSVLMIVCTALTALGAQLKLNLGPIPYTAQNFGFILAGLLLPPRYACASQLLYLFMIAIGLPIAAGFRGGIHVLIGYTAGYLWMFPVAAMIMSMLTRRYLARKGISLDSIKMRDIAFLLLFSLIASLPVYIVGFTVFYLYAIAPAYSKLFSWASAVSRFVGLSFLDPVSICFVASVLVFIPQDVFVDHLAAIIVARAIYSTLRVRGLIE